MATFRAMTTDVAVIAEGVDGCRLVDAIARHFADAERRFSRFLADSELARLNRATGPVVVSAPLFDALVAARRYVTWTDGIFEPAIGGALVALGYDRSFAPGALDRDRDVEVPRAATLLDVQLDASHSEVTRPAAVQLDLGGMIKGRTVDEAAAWLPAHGAIDAGGDAVLRGGGWLVEIEDPRDPARTLGVLRVGDRAVATSAANRRRWQVGGTARHHLVDPRTRRPAVTDLLQVTVVAPTAELADVVAKTVFVLGVRAGRAFVERDPRLGAVLVRTTGAPIACGAIDVVELDRD
jgi:thiamine biosynthesis lipoprotein